jgi:hypothetical protein
MRLLRGFLRQSPARRRLLLGAAAAVAGARLALCCPVRRWRRALLVAGRAAPRGSGPDTPIETIAWAVTAAARYVPHATCLPQALAARWVLARFGHASRVRFGIRKSEGGPLVAHAWLECEGRSLLEGDLAYQALEPVDARM